MESEIKLTYLAVLLLPAQYRAVGTGTGGTMTLFVMSWGRSA